MKHERNGLQRLMRYWSRLHPYHAVGIVQIRAPADPARLHRSACDVFESLGMSRVIEESDDRHFRFEAGPANIPIETVACPLGEDENHVIATQATIELNRPFADDANVPVRLFVVPNGTTHYFGLTFQHWIADGVSSNNLITQILSRYLQATPLSEPALSELGGPTYRQLFGGQLGVGTVSRCAWQTMRRLLAMRFCHCPYQGDRNDLRVEASFCELAPDTLHRLKQRSRQSNVSINDLLLAALADAIATNTHDRLRYGRRRDLALAAIVNLRPLAAQQLRGKLGLYLAYSPVICRSAATRGFERLLRAIRAQTARIKDRPCILESIAEFELASALWPRLPPGSHARYYANQMPIAALLSNLRGPDAWYSGPLGEHVMGVRFAVSTGPMVPLAVTVLTGGNRITVGCTSRLTGFRSDRVQAITAHFCGRLEAL